ncbi:NCAPD2 family protein [Megaselia abdita]
MEFQFVIPSIHSELLHSQGANYFVRHEYTDSEIPEQLKACKTALYRSDAFYIFDYFDTFFSVIQNSESLSATNLDRSFDLLYASFEKLTNQLLSFLDDSAGAQQEGGRSRNEFLNLVKMSVYLFVNVAKAIDQQCMQQRSLGNPTGKKNKKSNENTEDEFTNWNKKCFSFLCKIYNILQINIEKLWSPPVAEESFVNLICDICYRFMENAANKERKFGDTIFQILGIAIKRYNHAMTFPVKTMQIIRSIENVAPVIASGITILSEEFGINSIFGILINEIVDCIAEDAADGVLVKNISTFLIELCNVASKLLLPHLSTISEELLNCESHLLRNSCLQVIGDTIASELSSENLSEEMKEVRNEFLENLITHFLDVSAHVRVKVLQIWVHLKENNCIPLTYQSKVLMEGVNRLFDKTSTVRKAAIHLIKSFLENNPFAPKLPLEEMIEKYKTACDKMEELQKMVEEEKKKAEEVEADWLEVVPKLMPIIVELLSGVQVVDDTRDDNFDELVQKIVSHLTAEEYKQAVKLVKRADVAAGTTTEVTNELTPEEKTVYYMTLMKSYLMLSKGCKDSNEELKTQLNTVKFLQDSVNFAKIINIAVPQILEMLQSKTNSDVLEAVDFFTYGYMFGIRGTEEGMRRMLYLVWSTEKEKSEAVGNAYKKVLFSTDLSGRAHAIKVIQNLCSFLVDLETGHYIAFEDLISEWVKNEDIDSMMIQVLFEMFTKKLPGSTNNDSRLALQLLIIASSAKSTIAAANLNVIDSIGFGEQGTKDARIFCGCLEFYVNSIDSKVTSKYYSRLDKNSGDSVIEKITDMYTDFFFNSKTPNMDKITMKFMQFIYVLCQSPDVLTQDVIISLFKRIKLIISEVKMQIELNETETQPNISENLTEIEDILTQPTTQSDVPIRNSEIPEQNKPYVPTFLLTRFIFLIGCATMKELIFLDIDVYNNIKWREELKKEKTKKGPKFNKRKTHGPLDISASGSLKRLSTSAAEPQQEPDEDLVGATAEDNIAELIAHICENVLLQDEKSILPQIIPVVLEICKYPSIYRDFELQQTASLTLIRFMTVSSKFCEDNMAFLMNVLNLTVNAKIKCNIIIGLSDLTFRYPNIIEPWTTHFYNILHEKDDNVRLTAIKILSHLILHEMIRVKGQIADLALCIIDENDDIRDITKSFFREIANKANILYNVMPDIISRLSDTSLNIREEDYQIIMKYILSLIQKDRQVETLVEKLCARFKITKEERQWRDIAYCLSLLNYNEKTMKKLIDNISNFKDKVQIDEVYQYFKTIITNTNKLAKPELKAIVTEFETRLNKCLDVGDDTEMEGNTSVLSPSMEQSQPTTSKKAKPINKKPTKKPPTRGLRPELSSNSESEDDRNTRKGTRSQAKKKGSKVIQESESSSEDSTAPQRKKGRKIH